MTREEIRAKSLQLAELYTAKANGKILEYDTKAIGWVDNGSTSGPDMQSDLSRWRVKPEPRRMWQKVNEAGGEENTTTDPIRVMLWRQAGHTVIEWMEVPS